MRNERGSGIQKQVEKTSERESKLKLRSTPREGGRKGQKDTGLQRERATTRADMCYDWWGIWLPGSGGLQVRLFSRTWSWTGNGLGWPGWEAH